MRLSFLTLPTDERRLYIDQAAIRRNVSAVVLEKDFWVCWLLGLLFGKAANKSGGEAVLSRTGSLLRLRHR
jgi:hypothetical protein